MSGIKRSFFERLFAKKQPQNPEKPPPEVPAKSSPSPEDQDPPPSSAVSTAGEMLRIAQSLPLEVDALARRANRAAESFLENEALTDGLEDSAAKEMLDWAVERARQIAGKTAGLDDEQADQATYEQMRSLRHMVRSAARWASAGTLEAQDQLDALLAQAESAFGSNLPHSVHAREILQQAGNDSTQRIAALRKLIEGNNPDQLE